MNGFIQTITSWNFAAFVIYLGAYFFVDRNTEKRYNQGKVVMKEKTNNMNEISEKSRLAVTLLSWFLGGLGVHRFYLGKIGTGILMIFTLGGFGIWWMIDFIYAVSGTMKDKNGLKIEKW